jgi:hypothetical protein
MLSSAASESPALGLAVRRGKRIRDALYALRRLELSARDSSLRLRRRWSTAIPIVGASFLEMPAALSS